MQRWQRFLIASALLVVSVALGILTSGSARADTIAPFENSSIESTDNTKTNGPRSETLTNEEKSAEVSAVSPQFGDENKTTQSTNSAKETEDQQKATTTDNSSAQSGDSGISEVNNNSSSEAETKITKTETTDKKIAGVTKKSDVVNLKPVKIVQSNGSKVEIAPTEIKNKFQNTDKKEITSVTKYDSKVLPKTDEAPIKIVLILLGAVGLFVCGLIVNIYRKYG